MGMFDTIINSCDLGEDYTGCTLQTKDLNCIMSEYWLDPNGNLYEIDFQGTQSFEWNQHSDHTTPIVRAKPNGTRGRVKTCYLSAYIKVIPQDKSVDYGLTLKFEDGRLKEHFIVH